MIRYQTTTGNDLRIEQVTNRPSIYLDQWMWCALSEDSETCRKFLKAATKVNSTVLYSFATLFELGRIGDAKQLSALSEVMDSLDYGFIDVSPTDVIERERKHETAEGGTFSGLNPVCDTESITVFAQISDSLKPFRVSHFMNSLVHERDKLGAQRYKAIAESFEQSLGPLVEKARKDQQVLARAKRRHKARRLERARPPYTLDLLRLAIDFVVVNESMIMNQNEWLDLMHTVVPVAYSDFVLLDKRWCHFIRQNCPLHHPDISQIFKRDELDMFFASLGSFMPG